MHVHCLFVIHISRNKHCEIIETAFDEKEFFFWERSNVQQVFHSTGMNLAMKLAQEPPLPPEEVTCADNGPYNYYGLMSEDFQYVVLATTTKDYPHIAAVPLLRILGRSVSTVKHLGGYLDLLLEQAQNPEKFSRYLEIQQDLQETSALVKKTVTVDLMERAEHLDAIEKNAGDMSTLAQKIFRDTRGRNSVFWATVYRWRDWILSFFEGKAPAHKIEDV